MAQILKFQQGGTLTIDGIKYDINNDLVSQYRFLGREFDDDHEKKYYNQFMSTLNKGLSDKSVNIVICVMHGFKCFMVDRRGSIFWV